MPQGTLENTSGSKIVVADIGIPTGGTFTLDTTDNDQPIKDAIDDITTKVTAGDLVVRDENNLVVAITDLLAWADGKRRIITVMAEQGFSASVHPVYAVTALPLVLGSPAD